MNLISELNDAFVVENFYYFFTALIVGVTLYYIHTIGKCNEALDIIDDQANDIIGNSKDQWQEYSDVFDNYIKFFGWQNNKSKQNQIFIAISKIRKVLDATEENTSFRYDLEHVFNVNLGVLEILINKVKRYYMSVEFLTGQVPLF